jgi:serine/threonine protein kinase
MSELRKLGRYEIIREIGRGGMSTVHLAYDPVFEREVALKLLPREFLHDPSFRARFEREAKSIAKIEHAAIVPVYDFGEEDRQPFLVMRYMTGGTLADQLEDGPLSIEDAQKILVRLANALGEAHDRGMVHRDIKPRNVLFDHHHDAFLTDFGIVKLTQETTTYTGSGIIGTPAYMSPEQARGDRDIDARSDVYALGAILFEMLTGRPPYMSETVMGLAIKHLTEPIPSILALKPDLPPGLEQLIQTAMCKEREGRYTSVSQLADAFRKSITEVPETIIDKPAPPETVISEADFKSTIIESATKEEKTEEPETVLEAPQPVIEKKPFKVPIWAFVATGIVLIGIILALLIPKLGIFTPAPSPTLAPTPLPTMAPVPPETPEPTFQPVSGPDPSPLVAVFYYPWYGNPDHNGGWIYWEREGLNPPMDISSDYYPLAGIYSSSDPVVVAQHFVWLRYAGVGVIVSSWWGQGSFEDQAVPLLLELGERYGIKVAFHIEPYEGRNADQLIADIQYLYDHYGAHPAFFRTSNSSPWILDNRKKGLFFLRGPQVPHGDQEAVDPDYWRGALDAIHDMPDGGIVIANTTDPNWVNVGHFDGIYNYASHDADFNWSINIPMNAWYTPCVMPGFSAQRLGYPKETFLPRNQGETYHHQWNSALDTGIEPQMVVITSFNQWHEGTQIEPAAPGFTTDQGFEYMDYGEFEPEIYLTMTNEWVNVISTKEWPPVYRVQFRIKSTSDWTDLVLLEGGTLIRPDLEYLSNEALGGGFNHGQFFLQQEVTRAEEGFEVELIMNLLLMNLDPEAIQIFQIERGYLGTTEVQIMNYIGDEPVLVETIQWDGIAEGSRNAKQFEIPSSLLIEPPS